VSSLKCRFCDTDLDADFDEVLNFKGIPYLVCHLDDCGFLTALKADALEFLGGYNNHPKRGEKCSLLYKFHYVADYFLVEFDDLSNELCHRDNLKRPLKDDL